jgi:hypothetical protein
MISNGSRWKHKQRSAAILAAVRRGLSPQAVAQQWGLSPQAVAQQYGVSLRAVLAISEATEQRERFARERADSGGRVRVRILDSEEDVCR